MIMSLPSSIRATGTSPSQGTSRRRVLLIGATGKISLALQQALGPLAEVHVCGRPQCDAANPASLLPCLERTRPDVVFNTVVFGGIDLCEQEPEMAFRINALFPRWIAAQAAVRGFRLVHFSTDAVFADSTGSPWAEGDRECPLNVYGTSKLAGDHFVATLAPQHTLVRLSVQFGHWQEPRQFVEKMLGRIAAGAAQLHVASDLIASPSYSADVAERLGAWLQHDWPDGLVHLVNEGNASLHDLMVAICRDLYPAVQVAVASHADFPGKGPGRKNLRTPMISRRLPPMRPWRQAVAAFCQQLRTEGRAPVGEMISPVLRGTSDHG